MVSDMFKLHHEHSGDTHEFSSVLLPCGLHFSCAVPRLTIFVAKKCWLRYILGKCFSMMAATLL
jgi:hypothetical protein